MGNTFAVLNPDGTTSWFHINQDGTVSNVRNEPSIDSMATDAEVNTAIANHTHTTLANLEITGIAKFSGNVYAEDKKGENATVIIPNVGTIKFKHGIMHEFTPV